MMSKELARSAAVTAVMLLTANLVLAAEKPPAEKATYTVERGAFKIEISLSGAFEAERMTPISRVPKAWGKMKVLWAAQPGDFVKEGDPLVKLETKGLEKKTRDIEAGRALAVLALKQAREELRLLEITTTHDRAWAKRTKRIADEDFQHYMKSDCAYKQKYLALDRTGTDLWLETVKTELRELKRMYEADDLVETTEKLVLMRQEHGMKRTLVDYERALLRHAFRETKQIPRELEQKEKSVRDAEIALDRAVTMLDITRQRKRLQAAKMEYDRAEADKSLADHKADLETMVIRAPAGGILYYGKCVRGRWPTAGGMANKLKPGGQLGPHEVFMTIVQPAKMFVRAEAAETHLHDLELGMRATIIPTGYPKHKFTGKVTSVKIVPSGPAPYAVTVSLKGPKGPILPGMTCQVQLLAYENKTAITVPAKAVFTEPEDEDARYVYVQTAEDKAVKRPVTVGRQKGDKIEVLDGLYKGNVILLKEPGR